ncbi:site-specific integrase [Methylococcus sp. EFPC2]|uniref:tyrosine-type recombinase/integrase n=1 Tax=Methylococcus sp. EFPC2 TaxID=2812648 RepID=UPI0019683FF9|nr:site-specific integrase [Methylococcus sp. EFPC2]QSA97725.1 site-specific integrase [Methylococcus sp. EFPC2]
MATIEKRETQDGKSSYRVKVRLKGYPAQSETFDRLTDAKKWAAATESAIREGRHFKTAEAKKHTLGELIDRYTRDVLPNEKPKERAKKTTNLARWKDELGHALLSDLTPAAIVAVRDKLSNEKTARGKPRGPATVTSYMNALSAVLSLAVNEWGWLEDNPMRKVKKPSPPRGRVRFLSDDERAALLQACRESSNALLYPAVVLGLSTGMRQGEILGLYWREPKRPPEHRAWGVVDVAAARITLHLTKNGERRVVPLVGHALESVKELAKVRRLGTDLLFPGKVDPNEPIDLRQPWEAALKRAEIEDFRFHDLRHSAASYLAMNGASLAEIAETLGHKTLQMVKRYSHLSDAHVSSVVERMNAKIFG